MNNIYITFLINKINLLDKVEYLMLVLILLLIISLFFSLFLNIGSNKSIDLEKQKLLNKEKLLINLNNLFKNGHINAKEYKERIANLIKNINL